MEWEKKRVDQEQERRDLEHYSALLDAFLHEQKSRWR
jgi:hypothetical protein